MKITTYEEYKEWNKRCMKERQRLADSISARATALSGASPEVPEPPKQNTEEVGHWRTLVTEFHAKVADTMLDYVYLTSDYTRGLFMMDFAGQMIPSKDSLIKEKLSDGYYKIEGGLPPEEYEKLIGSQNWETIASKYEDEKYLVYDDEQDKDPSTQLFPEFDLMFRNGLYIKWSWKKFKGDNQPKMSIDVKSAKEYGKQ